MSVARGPVPGVRRLIWMNWIRRATWANAGWTMSSRGGGGAGERPVGEVGQVRHQARGVGVVRVRADDHGVGGLQRRHGTGDGLMVQSLMGRPLQQAQDRGPVPRQLRCHALVAPIGSGITHRGHADLGHRRRHRDRLSLPRRGPRPGCTRPGGRIRRFRARGDCRAGEHSAAVSSRGCGDDNARSSLILGAWRLSRWDGGGVDPDRHEKVLILKRSLGVVSVAIEGSSDSRSGSPHTPNRRRRYEVITDAPLKPTSFFAFHLS